MGIGSTSPPDPLSFVNHCGGQQRDDKSASWSGCTTSKGYLIVSAECCEAGLQSVADWRKVYDKIRGVENESLGFSYGRENSASLSFTVLAQKRC